MWVKKKNVCDGEGKGRTLNTTMLYTHAVSSGTIPYSGKLSREKTFGNFAVLWLFAKVFSAKFGSVVSFGTARASNLQKFSS